MKLFEEKSGFLYMETGLPPALSTWQSAHVGTQYSLRDFPERATRNTPYCLPTVLKGTVSADEVRNNGLTEGLWVTVGPLGNVKAVMGMSLGEWKKRAKHPWKERRDRGRELLKFSRPFARLMTAAIPLRRGGCGFFVGPKGCRKTQVLLELLIGLEPGPNQVEMFFQAERPGEVMEEGADALRRLPPGAELWAVTMRDRDQPAHIVRWLNFVYSVAIARALAGQEIHLFLDSLEVPAKCLDTITQQEGRSALLSGGITRSTLDTLASQCIAIAGDSPDPGVGSLTIYAGYRANLADRGTANIAEDQEGVTVDFLAFLPSAKARATLVPLDLAASLSRSAEIAGRPFAESVWANVTMMLGRPDEHYRRLYREELESKQSKENEAARRTDRRPSRIYSLTKADEQDLRVEALKAVEEDWQRLLDAAETLDSVGLVENWTKILEGKWKPKGSSALLTTTLMPELAQPAVVQAAPVAATPSTAVVALVSEEAPVVARKPGIVVRQKRGPRAFPDRQQAKPWGDIPEEWFADMPATTEAESVPAVVAEPTPSVEATPAEEVPVPAEPAVSEVAAQTETEAPADEGDRPKKPPAQEGVLPALSGQKLDEAAEKLRAAWGALIRTEQPTHDEQDS